MTRRFYIPLILSLILVCTSSLHAGKRNKLSLFELRVSNNAVVSYQLSNSKNRSERVTGSIPVYRPGRYRIEIYSTTADSAEMLLYNAFIEIPRNRLLTAVLDPAQGLYITEERNFRKSRKEYRKFVREFQLDTSSFRQVPKYQPISADSFRVLHANVRALTDESAQLDYLKTALGTNYLTSAQIASLLEEVPSTDKRVQVGAFAHLKAVDTENYILVFEKIPTAQAKHELHSLINGYHAF